MFGNLGFPTNCLATTSNSIEIEFLYILQPKMSSVQWYFNIYIRIYTSKNSSMMKQLNYTIKKQNSAEHGYDN